MSPLVGGKGPPLELGNMLLTHGTHRGSVPDLCCKADAIAQHSHGETRPRELGVMWSGMASGLPEHSQMKDLHRATHSEHVAMETEAQGPRGSAASGMVTQ